MTFAAARVPSVRSAANPPKRLLRTLLLCGPLAVLVWLSLAWPLVCRVAPDLAYRVGDTSTRIWAVRYVTRDLKVGDSSARLHELLPTMFLNGASMTDGQFQLHDGSSDVTLTIENGRISQINLGL